MKVYVLDTRVEPWTLGEGLFIRAALKWAKGKAIQPVLVMADPKPNVA